MGLNRVIGYDYDGTGGIFYQWDNLKNQFVSGDLFRYQYSSKYLNISSQTTSPYGVYISSDGTKAYVLSAIIVYQYSLTTPFDINTASYSNKSLTFSAYEGVGQGMSFTEDGVNLYIVGYNNDRIIQYYLSTPWDISTATLYPLKKSFYYGSQTSNAWDVIYGDSGTKMYIIDSSNYRIYQYTLSTAYDVSTATYANKSFYIGTQSTFAISLEFKPDGTRFYVSDNNSDKFYQYDCSIPWDISTATYLLSPSPVITQDAIAPDLQGMYIGDSGTKMYIAGSTNDTIYQYTLSTPYDVSTATYANKSFSVATESIGLTGITFKTDGTKFYVSDTNLDRFYQYDCLTPWDISTGRYQLPSLSVSSQEATPTAMSFNSDGTVLFVMGTTNDTIYQYTLSTAYDTSTATYASKSFYIGTQEISAQGLTFKTDGTKFYICGSNSSRVYQYSLSSSWDISTASYDSKSFLVSSQDLVPTDISFSSDGTKLYVLGDGNNRLYQYNLSSAWDVSTSTYNSVSFLTTETSPTGLYFKSDGTKFYVIGTINDRVYQYSLTTPWSLSSASLEYTGPIQIQDGNPHSILFNSDGTKIYLLGNTNCRIYQYEVLTAYNISTMNVRYSGIIVSSIYEARDIEFSSDGTKMIVPLVYSSGTDYIQYYELSIAWQIFSASTVYALFSTDTVPSSVRYSSDGTKMYMLGAGSSKVYEYTLSPAWTINASTALVSMNNPAYVGNQDSSVTGMHFNNDGTKVYVLGNTNDKVFQYSLESAWSINSMNIGYCSYYSGANYSQYGLRFKPDGTRLFTTLDGVNNYIIQANLTSNSWNICSLSWSSSTGSGSPSPYGLTFSSDGTRFYVSCASNHRIYEFTLSSAWNLGSTVTQISHNNNTYFGIFMTSARGLHFNPNGNGMIILNGNDISYASRSNTIYQFELTTSWYMDTVNIGYKSILNQEGNSYGMTISTDGSKIYILGAGDTIYQYSMTTVANLGSFSYDSKSLNISSVVPDGRDLFISYDGKKLYVIDQTNDRIYQYTMTTTPFDITTASYTNKSVYIQSYDNAAEGIVFSRNLDRYYIIGRTNNTIYQFNAIK